MMRAWWLGMTVSLVHIWGCGLDLERRDGSLRVFLLPARDDSPLPLGAAVRLVVEHGETRSLLDYALAPELVIESVPSGASVVWAELLDGTLRSNDANVIVFEGEETFVGLWMLDAPNRDDDGDGRPGREDNCPFDANPAQADGDRDGLGDACDNCPTNPRPQPDLDGDGFGDGCDPDQDGDGTLDVLDACPRDASGTTDVDADGVCDPVDNCLQWPNPDQADCDQDRMGDACDLDIDGDGLANNQDTCPYSPSSVCADDPSACRVQL